MPDDRLGPRQVLVDDPLLVVVPVKRTRLDLVGETVAVEREPAAPVSAASDVADGLLSIRAEDEVRPPVFGTVDCVGYDLEGLFFLVEILPLQEAELDLFVEGGHLKNMLSILFFCSCFFPCVFFFLFLFWT